MSSEQAVLRASIVATILVAAFGIVFGLLSRSYSIAFDGIYSLADAGMSVLALIVSGLISRSARSGALSDRLQHRFSMGFWHLEPIVLGLDGVLLVTVSIYALINAAMDLRNGGHTLEFDYAIIYAVVTFVACIVMAGIGIRSNKHIQSDFIALDAKAWIMSGGISASLLIAFSIGYLVDGTKLGWIVPYIDSAVLMVVCLVLIPVPISTIRQAFLDILLVTPEELNHHVERVAEGIVAKHGFVSYRAYVAKVGRAKQIELYFIVPDAMPAKTIHEWDLIRDEIGETIGFDTPDRWLTIAFTADTEWAE